MTDQETISRVNHESEAQSPDSSTGHETQSPTSKHNKPWNWNLSQEPSIPSIPSIGFNMPGYDGYVHCSESYAKIAAALAAVQMEIADPKKTQTARYRTKKNAEISYQYASLADFAGEARATLSKHGIAILQFPVQVDLSSELNDNGPGRKTAIYTLLLHENEEYIESLCVIPSFSSKAGACITYARRCALMPLLGLAAEDEENEEEIRASRIKRKSGPRGPRPANAADIQFLKDEIERLQLPMDRVCHSMAIIYPDDYGNGFNISGIHAKHVRVLESLFPEMCAKLYREQGFHEDESKAMAIARVKYRWDGGSLAPADPLLSIVDKMKKDSANLYEASQRRDNGADIEEMAESEILSAAAKTLRRMMSEHQEAQHDSGQENMDLS